MVDFSYSDICWTDNTAGHKQFRRFLERTEALTQMSFLTQVMDEPMRGGVC